MRVMFIGAGASIGAKYPPGQELLGSVERHFNEAVIDVVTRSSLETVRRSSRPSACPRQPRVTAPVG